MSNTTTNTDPCCFTIGHRPANGNLEFDNVGSDLLLGLASDEWATPTGNHSKGICCIKDRLSYDDDPQLVGIAPTKLGIRLRKSILVKLHTLR